MQPLVVAAQHLLTNLAASPEHANTLRALHEGLSERLDLDHVGRQVLASQRERRLIAGALARGEITPWDYQPHVDAAMQYVRNRADLYDLQRRARLEVEATIED